MKSIKNLKNHNSLYRKKKKKRKNKKRKRKKILRKKEEKNPKSHQNQLKKNHKLKYKNLKN